MISKHKIEWDTVFVFGFIAIAGVIALAGLALVAVHTFYGK